MRTLKLVKKKKTKKKKKSPVVGIIMGSKSDLPVMEKATLVLERFKIPYEIKIVSAHRTPDLMARYAKGAHKKGMKVIIAGAGGAAHLPGMVASYTTLPVIGVPINITSLKGLDSFLSILQMPKGVPVATVAVDSSENAALLAVRMLGINSKKLTGELKSYAQEQKKKVLKSKAQ
jgi:phosphoribosylaminoimidazole carboxylase PurE protein